MTRLRWLLGTALRGLWARKVLTLGSLLLTVIAIASAVVGPSYQGTASNSFVISQLAAQPLINTGLTFDYQPSPVGETVDHAIATAVDEAAKEAGPSYLPGHAIVWDPLKITLLPGSGTPAVPQLISAAGACEHIVLKGRCPTNPGDIAILRADATTYGLKLGSTLNPYHDQTPFTVVGIYQPSSRPADDAFWFGPGRLQSIPGRLLPQLVPSRPAPWITPQVGIELRHSPWYVTVDHQLKVTPTLTPGDAALAATRAANLHHAAQHGGLPSGLGLEAGNVLPSTVHRLLARRGVARSTVTPAVLSLILVALVLLSRLLSAAMGLRRGELALASLRGYNRRQLWFLGMLEPLLILAAATPLGVGFGYLAARELAARWLVHGLPVPFVLASGLTVVAVILVTGVVAALVVRDAVNEPLSAQIAGVRRPAKASRVLVIVRLALLAAAAAALVTAASRNKPKTPDATDLGLPILLAIAAGLISGLLVLAVSGVWVRWSGRRRALSSYVAARTVRRRREGTLVILPLTAAMTIAVFTIGVSLAAATWRSSTAATEVGAPLSYPTELSLSRAVGLTHRIDPAGRWLMAAAVSAPNTELDNDDVTSIQPRIVLDTPRMARVASWPAQWTPGESAAQIADKLGPHRPSVVLRGSRLTLTVDNRVSGQYPELGLSLDVLDPDGAEREVNVGPYPRGTSTASTRIPHCVAGCVLQTIQFGGPAGLVESMHGTATISQFAVDGAPVPGALDAPWRAATAQITGAETAVKTPPRLSGGHLHVSFQAKSPSSFAGISPTDVPAVVPVLWGRLATQRTKLPTGASGTFTARSIGLSESVPYRGPSGMLIDYTMFARNTTLDNSTTQVYVWARADTPRAVRNQLAAHGLSHADSETAAKHLLDEDAFALALRLYVVVTVLVILLALAGLGANLAVQLPNRRRDAASLRVVGVKRRAVMIGVVAEFLVVLGAAALAGVAAGALAQYLVVRSVTLGFADNEVTPRVLPSINVTSVVELSAAVLVVLLAFATAFAVLTVRGARTSSLRENAR
jgi:putative ABC transport system permease protein